jgi:ribonuclease HI
LLREDGTVLDHNSGLLIPTPDWPTVTNNYAEYAAVVHGLEACPEGANVCVHTDSMITLGRMLWGWAHNGLPTRLVDRMQDAMVRLGTVTGVLLDGHPTKRELAAGKGKRGNPVSEHNVWCDQECTRLVRTFRLQSRTKGEQSDG